VRATCGVPLTPSIACTRLHFQPHIHSTRGCTSPPVVARTFAPHPFPSSLQVSRAERHRPRRAPHRRTAHRNRKEAHTTRKRMLMMTHKCARSLSFLVCLSLSPHRCALAASRFRRPPFPALVRVRCLFPPCRCCCYNAPIAVHSLCTSIHPLRSSPTACGFAVPCGPCASLRFRCSAPFLPSLLPFLPSALSVSRHV
jgi:hypothetical protein